MMTPSGFWVKVLINTFKVFLGFFPGSFRDEFGEEMQAVFADRTHQAARQGYRSFIQLAWGEFTAYPPLLIRVHWFQWQKLRRFQRSAGKKAGGFHMTSDFSLQDGRDSWKQAALEISLFAALGFIIVLQTYLPIPQAGEGWTRTLGMTGPAILVLAVPVLLVGLLRGLPRWALPFAGILTGYALLMAAVFQLLPYLAIVALIIVGLVIAAFQINAHTQPLPSYLQHLASDLCIDWPRLSFGIYGAAPLLILLAYDDAVLNNRTPFLAVSVLFMIIGALWFARSRRPSNQLFALVGGLTFSIWPALLDEASFKGGLIAWSSEPGTWSSAASWLLGLWVCAVLLLCIPFIIRWVKPGSITENAA
jgi:hypothetical protein